jgi:hypothetical protein
MGEELELGNLFIVCDDGTYVPFEGTTEIDLNDIPSDAVYDPIVPINNEPMTITFDMKRRDHRKMLKFFKKQVNAMGRRIRYLERQKERARRRKLKGARYV